MYRIVWSVQAEADLNDCYDWILEAADPETAGNYIANIKVFAERLILFPHKGTPRPDLAPDLRSTAYRRRTTLIYRVVDETVEIVRMAQRGWDVARMFVKNDQE